MNGLRRINLEQAINVRDLGGYPTPDGCTPYGRFIRADNMVLSLIHIWMALALTLKNRSKTKDTQSVGG